MKIKRILWIVVFFMFFCCLKAEGLIGPPNTKPEPEKIISVEKYLEAVRFIIKVDKENLVGRFYLENEKKDILLILAATETTTIKVFKYIIIIKMDEKNEIRDFVQFERPVL